VFAVLEEGVDVAVGCILSLSIVADVARVLLYNISAISSESNLKKLNSKCKEKRN